MTKLQRKMLVELCDMCNELGSSLDGTATNPQKYMDRQFAHRHVYKALYGVLVDVPENDQREHDLEVAEKAMSELRLLTKKSYPDRKGFTSFQD